VFTLSPHENEGTTVPNTIAPTTGVPSTVIRWTGSGWDLLRQGAVSFGDEE